MCHLFLFEYFGQVCYGALQIITKRNIGRATIALTGTNGEWGFNIRESKTGNWGIGFT